MDGIDHTFGLAPDSSGASRLDTEWGDYCAWIGVDSNARSDAAAIARQISSSDNAAGTARIFNRVLDNIGLDSAAPRLTQLIADIIDVLPGDAVRRIMSALEVPDRRSFMTAAARNFPPTALLKATAGAASAYGHPFSSPLTRLLDKLRTEAQTLPEPLRPRAEESFRSLIQHLVDTWSAAAVSAASTTYDDMFAVRVEKQRSSLTPEPVRVLQVALESGAIGNVVWGAVAEQSKDEDGMRELFDLLKRAPAGSRATIAIAEHVATPARLSNLLKEEPVDWDALDVIVVRMGLAAVRPLLDELVEAKSRHTRRAIMDRLVHSFGPEIGPHVIERLGDPRWYVVRNMIALLREAGCSLTQVPIDKFRAHEDARVRRETLQLQLENAATRDDALLQALQDNDKNVLRTALQAARSNLPERAVPVLAKRVTDGNFPPEFRVMSLFLLGRSSSPVALDALLAYAGGGSSLFGKPKLAAKTPEMLAALGGLARSWGQDKRAAALLDLARKSKDDQILNALHANPSADDR
jgi:hypothetical protein